MGARNTLEPYRTEFMPVGMCYLNSYKTSAEKLIEHNFCVLPRILFERMVSFYC